MHQNSFKILIGILLLVLLIVILAAVVMNSSNGNGGGGGDDFSCSEFDSHSHHDSESVHECEFTDVECTPSTEECHVSSSSDKHKKKNKHYKK